MFIQRDQFFVDSIRHEIWQLENEMRSENWPTLFFMIFFIEQLRSHSLDNVRFRPWLTQIVLVGSQIYAKLNFKCQMHKIIGKLATQCAIFWHENGRICVLPENKSHLFAIYGICKCIFDVETCNNWRWRVQPKSVCFRVRGVHCVPKWARCLIFNLSSRVFFIFRGFAHHFDVFRSENEAQANETRDSRACTPSPSDYTHMFVSEMFGCTDYVFRCTSFFFFRRFISCIHFTLFAIEFFWDAVTSGIFTVFFFHSFLFWAFYFV